MKIHHVGAENSVETLGRAEAEPSASICIHHSGRCFTTTRERAGIFLRHAQAVADQGANELVPLLHGCGLDILFVAANAPLRVHDVGDPCAETAEPMTTAHLPRWDVLATSEPVDPQLAIGRKPL